MAFYISTELHAFALVTHQEFLLTKTFPSSIRPFLYLPVHFIVILSIFEIS